ncbi:MAG TPA: MFS transporter [Jiangellaceae bacterium]|nr:MFS transporter [Jiangellaceae bacterium]
MYDSTGAGVDQRAGRREWVGLTVLALACLLYAMDMTVLHLAVPMISADLQPSSVELLWIIDIYGFMVAGCLITMGTLGDRIGRRRLLLLGAGAFGAVSLLAAFSTSPGMLMVSRALLGIAGATLAPSTLSLIFNMFRDARQRSIAIGIWIGAFSAGGAVGPVFGGILLESFWWGSVFLLAIPVMAVLLVLGPIVLPEYRDPNAGRLDLVSAGMSLIAVLSAIYGLKRVAQDGFDGVAALSILVGLTVAVAFARRQLTHPDPMIDLRLFRVSAFRSALAINVLGLFVAFGYFLFVAQYLQLVLGLSPLQAGVWSMPAGLGFIVGSQLGPRIVQVFRPATVIAGGLALAAVGLGLLTQVSASSGLALVVVSSLIISIGLAPVFGLTTELIVGSAPPERAGAASGISETGAEFGGALGISILGSLGVAIYRGDLGRTLDSVLLADQMATAQDTLGGAAIASGALPTELAATVMAAAHEAFVHGMHVTSALAGVSAVVLAGIAVATLRHLRPVSEHLDADDTTGQESVAATPVQVNA